MPEKTQSIDEPNNGPILGEELRRKISEHPCYDKNAQHKYGRIHLAVAPKCNIQCNFCVREFDCVNESRPGVTSKVLTPEEALEKTKQILAEYPFIKVVAIAGPGDPLANDETFETFELIRKEFPEITLCMSTNGLMLPEKLQDMLRVGVSTLTVTVNAIDPEIQAKIVNHIVYHGKVYRGVEAAEIQIKNQLQGIKAAVDAGIVVKVNTVLTPGINDKHVVEIAKKLNELGVYIMNVMPLINQGAFADLEPPTAEERKDVQAACEPYVMQMRHCRQCRADAYGLLAQDMSQMSEERRNIIKIQTKEDMEKAREILEKNGKEEKEEKD
ncbi:MAG: nitrogenase cofactor biosynthesis protein NifB [Methanosarcina sp.]|uniref:nitrogenase cofactor biosynthesis protein NifB n=1 Tax=Methanosarcina sp. TaxID=2213 RepID=UPI00262D1DA2|nr:nitrogenase cofactor biosynthesis protein NifB [Methanosarcina sp.]MDD3248209.1 nitrogenase cofactor biosynthesis protein NifB [Methanosarcina sp.]MDD4248079.1 nitrogenase cofactor biosynthesis protein NifB [Methanosarcina sp.]